ncbi:MAG: MATE family efflux transporter [Clostridia bacterium]|nr:MATE family efflux transporter [Clostridia bacterium]
MENTQQETKRLDLTEGSIPKTLMRFFFPIAFGMLFQQLYNTVDAVIVGQFVGTGALAAVGGSAAVLINLVIGFFNGLAGGATVIISQQYGGGDYERLKKTVHTIMLFGILGSLALTFAMYFIVPFALKAVKSPADVFPDSVLYLRIYFAGTVPLMLYNIGSGILRAVGDSKRPLYFLAASCIVNIVLDVLFVRVFALGVAGVGLATVLSVVVSAVLTVGTLMRSKDTYRVRIKDLAIDGPALSASLRIGIPAGIQSTMFSFSNLLVQKAVNELGTTFVAAWTATGKLDGIFWMISASFGSAICAVAGQCFGAGKYDRMKESIRTCLIIAEATSIAFAVIILLVIPYGLRLITNDPAVIASGSYIMRFFAPFYFVWIIIEVFASGLRGAGDALRPTLIVVLGICGIRILWMLLVIPFWHTEASVSWVYAVSWTPTAIAFLLYYYKSDWLGRVLPGRKRD